jgi:SOS response regulatory protein OraA/RecX
MTIEKLKPKQLLTLIDSLPFVPIHVTKNGADEPEVSKKKGRAGPESKMTLTGKSAQKGSNREAILTTFEKLEVKHGIGSVTRKMLREKCSEKGQDAQIIYQLIREGYLKTL